MRSLKVNEAQVLLVEKREKGGGDNFLVLKQRSFGERLKALKVCFHDFHQVMVTKPTNHNFR